MPKKTRVKRVLKSSQNESGSKSVKTVAKGNKNKESVSSKSKDSEQMISKTSGAIDKYNFKSMNIPVTVTIQIEKGDYVPTYSVNISVISDTTQIILEKLREELIRAVNLGVINIRDTKQSGIIESKFSDTIQKLIGRYFPDAGEDEKSFMTTYLIQRSLGMGNLEILNDDNMLEEIVINSASSPVWVYHKKHGWLKTNMKINTEDKIKHYAVMMGRKVGRQLSILEPLLDAHLDEGDRVNATLYPISTDGNTITIRRFSRDPWTITHFLESKTMSPNAAALIWQGIQYELSALIAGGTASGKTSTLNVLANFFPPNQRILSIEDTRELQLPEFLHWVPLSTRLANVEGKGSVTMEDLLVNSLRMRPDRILVGEVRRRREAETLFEAIHTGHSCYATFHANDAKETINRLTHPPIDVPETMLPAISMIIIQFRNRRTGLRRSFQIAEILPDSKANVLMQYDPKKDVLTSRSKSKSLYNTLEMFTGSSPKEINRDINEKEEALKYMVKQQIKNINDVGRFVAEYYTNTSKVMKFVRANKPFLKKGSKAENNKASGKDPVDKVESALGIKKK